jgi:hypothetical protein
MFIIIIFVPWVVLVGSSYFPESLFMRSWITNGLLDV